MRVRIAVAAGLAVLLVAVLAVLLQKAPRAAYGSGRAITAADVDLVPGARFCQDNEFVPADAASISFAVPSGARSGPPLEVTVTYRGRTVLRGVGKPVYDGGHARLGVKRLARGEVTGATVCFRNVAGRGQATLLGAEAPSASGRIATAGARFQSVPVLATFDWFRAGEESWLHVSPRLAERAALTKASWIGDWTFWAAFAALAVCVAGGSLLFVREAEA